MSKYFANASERRIIENPMGACPVGWVVLNSEQEKSDWLSALPALPQTAALTVPWAISNADLRRQLALRGIDPDDVTSYLKASISDVKDRRIAVADWDYANYFERAHPMFNPPPAAFGLTASDIDAMFIACKPYPRQ